MFFFFKEFSMYRVYYNVTLITKSIAVRTDHTVYNTHSHKSSVTKVCPKEATV